MEELIVKLIGECRVQEAVATSTLENGMHVFVYPLPDQRMLMALGVGPDAALTPGELLARRSAQLRRAGGWLPALFNDGSLYLLRRLESEEEEGGAALMAQLRMVEELLN